VKKSLLLVNFADGLGYTKKQIDAKPVRSHTTEELQAIVNTIEIKRSRPERFFIPLFGLYQGVRLNEGCQLFVRDIVRDKETKLLCANIIVNDETGQKTKNQSSRRMVPIHPLILELGLENYWKEMKARDTDPANPLQLWPNNNLGVNGYTGGMSNWWGRFVDANVTKDEMVDFGSLRTNFINNLDAQGFVESQYQPIVGHGPKSVTGQHYREPKMQVFLKIIEKVDYGIDLSRLKEKSFWN
jgi:hypothetical protein